MNALQSITAASANGRGITLNELLYTLKITDRLDALRNVIDDVFIADEVAAQGIKAAPAELQAESDAVRQSLGLLRAADTHAWLKSRAMSVDDFEAYLSRRVTARKLKAKLSSEKIEATFRSRRPDFDRAKLWILVAENLSIAREVAEKLRAGENFKALAEKYSIDPETRPRGGFQGIVWRSQLDPRLASKVFLASPGSVVGPVRTDSGHVLALVEDIARASLDEETKLRVADLIFRDWLDERAAKSKLDFSLPQLIGAS